MRKGLRIVLPHVFVNLVLLGYLAFGAWFFRWLEKSEDDQFLRRKGARILGQYRQAAEIVQSSCGGEMAAPDWRKKLYTQLYALSSAHEGRHFDAVLPIGDDSQDPESVLPSRWNTIESTLYALSILTTTGYTYVNPTTPRGQIAAILYGMIGIPLTVIAAVDIGRFLSDSLLFIYKKMRKILRLCYAHTCISSIMKYIKQKRKEKRDMGRKYLKIAPAGNSPAVGRRRDSTWDVLNARKKNKKKRKCSLAMQQQAQTDGSTTDGEKKHDKRTCEACKKRRAARKKVSGTGSYTQFVGFSHFPTRRISLFKHSHNGTLKIAVKREAERKLPLWVNATILLLFCGLGAVCLRFFEEKYTLMDAFFIAFNLVANLTMAEMQATSMAAVVYIVCFVTFGLAVLTMCADLAASELKYIFMKIHYFGRKIRRRRRPKIPKEELAALVGFMDYLRTEHPEMKHITAKDLINYIEEMRSRDDFKLALAQHQLLQLATSRRRTQPFVPGGDDLRFVDDADASGDQQGIMAVGEEEDYEG